MHYCKKDSEKHSHIFTESEWEYLCGSPKKNKFKKIVIQRCLKRIHYVLIIQKQFMKSYYDPTYKMCKNRLKRQFSNLVSCKNVTLRN